MSYVQTTAVRNHMNPLAVSHVQQPGVPYVGYNDITLCADPNCPVCRAQRRDRGYKKHHHHRRHRRHRHRRGYRRSFWDGFLPRVESAGSISIHSVDFGDRRGYYNTNVVERAVAPVNQTEQQVVTTTAPRRVVNDEVVRDAWVKNFS